MADSVVHVEIEDVLDSVRRLVSEDVAESQPSEESSEVCFVLTPAHRIEVGKTEIGELNGGLPDVKETPDMADQPPELEQLFGEVSRPTENSAEKSPKETESPQTPETPANFSASEYQSMAEAWKKELAFGANTDSGPGGEPSATADEISGTTLEERIAELEAAVSRSRDDWEPDGSEPNRKPEIFRHLYEVVDNSEAKSKQQADAAIDEEPDMTADNSADQIPLKSGAAGFETDGEPETAGEQGGEQTPKMPPMGRNGEKSDVFVLSEQAPETGDSDGDATGLVEIADQSGPETVKEKMPDQISETDLPNSADQPPVFSHTEPGPNGPLMLVHPVKPADEQVEEQGSQPSSPDSDPPIEFKSRNTEVVQEDDVFLDVEALRTMIGELVRDELRGKMGERITHNVRQMVRQEIDRALLSRDDS